MKKVGKSFDLFHLSSGTLNEMSMKIVTSKMPFRSAITLED